jgi:diguanylate cyclase (GGDEF)-like protein/PAS domain S-box-containing protein
MEKELRILLVEDVETDAELEVRELKRAGLRLSHERVETEADFRSAIEKFQPHLILSDFSMPHFDGMWALSLARELAPDVPFIFVSGTIGEEYAIRALKNGATDYVLKNNLVRLPASVERALQDSAERAARRKAELELEETRSRLDGIVSSLSDVVWSVSPTPYRVLYASRAIEAVLGRSLESLQADPDAWLAQIHPEDRAPVERTWREALAGGQFEAVYRIVRDDGAVRWIHNRARAMRDDAGNVARLDGIARDITDLKEQEQRIARLSRIHAVLSGINSAIVRIRDRRQLFEEACRIAVQDGGFGIAWVGVVDRQTLDVVPEACAGVEAESLIARSLNTTRADSPLGQGIIGRALRERRPVYSNDITAEQSTGGARRQEAVRRGYRSLISLPLVVDDDVVGAMSLFAKELNFFDDEEIKLLTGLSDDISFALEHIARQEKLNYLAYYDQLTGLPNRTLFQERVNQALQAERESNGQAALLVIDLKRFGSVNNTYGRQTGDNLLKLVAERLENVLTSRELLARIESNSFAVVLRDVKHEADVAHALEQGMLASLGQPFAVANEELRLSAQVGIALFPADGADAESLFRNADAALKKAKNSGDPYLFYAPQMNARVAEQLKLENDLRNALRDDQYRLYYQPKFELATGTMVGMEALIRWQHPERGMVSPVDFIPLLEETGMILEVGRWALERAALDHAAWCAGGFRPPRIAVNVSPAQLRRRDFVAHVADALAAVAKAGERIDIEITESMLMEDVEGSIAKLKAMQAMGLHVAVDDFGTGYSSLSYLARLPINSLKIDRSFIIQMSKSPEQMAIVSTVISLARALNLKVVAEGVETEEQANLLRLLRCDEVQGYLFGKPVPPEEIAKLLPRAEKAVS